MAAAYFPSGEMLCDPTRMFWVTDAFAAVDVPSLVAPVQAPAGQAVAGMHAPGEQS